MSGDTAKTVLGIGLSGFCVLNGMRSLQNGRNALADVHDILSSARTIVRGLSLSASSAYFARAQVNAPDSVIDLSDNFMTLRADEGELSKLAATMQRDWADY
jgi:hypothetical protein